MPVGAAFFRGQNGDMSSHNRNRNRPMPPEHRYRNDVTNPAYITQVSYSQYRVSPAEALTKMKMLEHCDRAVINPMFPNSADHPSNDPVSAVKNLMITNIIVIIRIIMVHFILHNSSRIFPLSFSVITCIKKRNMA